MSLYPFKRFYASAVPWHSHTLSLILLSVIMHIQRLVYLMIEDEISLIIFKIRP